MLNIKKEISASEFKKYFLSLVDEVKTKNNSFVITKRKIPIAKVVPLNNVSQNNQSYFGLLKNSIKINDDIINADQWEAN